MWRFESSRESKGISAHWPCSSTVEHHLVTVRGAGSNPVAVATPWSFMVCQGDRIPVVKRTSCQATNLVLRVRLLPGMRIIHRKNQPGWRNGSASLLQSEGLGFDTLTGYGGHGVEVLHV
jgi:hypothetical protein